MNKSNLRWKSAAILLICVILRLPAAAQDSIKLPGADSFRYINFQYDSLSTSISGNLSGLRPLLKSNRVLLLGEQTHREGTVTSVKIELIKFFHEELGYNILALEDDFYEVYDLTGQISTKEWKRHWRDHLSPYMSDNAEFRELVEYVAKCQQTNNPLRIYGFDSQILNADNETLVADLYGFLAENGTVLSGEETELLNTQLSEASRYPHEGSPLATPLVDQSVSRLMKKIGSGLDKAGKAVNGKDKLFWQQVFFIIKETFEDIRQKKQGKSRPVQNFRDRIMAANLLYLTNRFPNEKIIAWGASYHFAINLHLYKPSEVTAKYAAYLNANQKSSSSFSYTILDSAVTMGDILKKKLEDQFYSLAFTTGSGSYGRPLQPAIPIMSPPEGSIEQSMRERNAGFSWIDFHDTPADTLFYAAPLGHLPLYARWASIFDGLLYTPYVRPLSVLKQDDLTLIKPKGPATGREGLAAYPNRLSTDPDGLTTGLEKSRITGRVINAEDGTAVPFANITVVGKPTGSTANENGRFEIMSKVAPKNIGETDTLVITAIGFKTAYIPFSTLENIAEREQIIKLKPSTIMLDQVIVTEKASMNPKTIIKGVIRNKDTNYPQRNNCLEMFYRSTEYKNDRIASKAEAVIGFYAPYAYSRHYDLNSYIRNHYGQIKQYRSKRARQTGQGISFAGLSYFDVLSGITGLLEQRKLRRYDFKLEKVTVYNSDSIFVVSFEDRKTRPIKAYNWVKQYHGKLYIHKNDLAILKYEALIERELPKVDSITHKELKESTSLFINIATTYQKQSGFYRLKAGKMTIRDTYFRRDEVLTKHEFLTTSPCKQVESTGNWKRLMNASTQIPEFDPIFWRNYNILLDEDS